MCVCVYVCDIQMDGQSWVWALMLAYFLFLGPFFVVGTFLNFVAVAYTSSAGWGDVDTETLNRLGRCRYRDTYRDRDRAREGVRGCMCMAAWVRSVQSAADEAFIMGQVVGCVV
jgi:hypothetical protein